MKTGKTLQATNADAPRHPASVTKVMTLYMLFEQLERGRFTLDSELKISAHAARQAPSKLGLQAGETISVEDAIKALVTKSANDIAAAVGENISGSEDRFAEMMTEKARSIGMKGSTFVNASGLPDPEQITTARDLALLGRAIQDRFPKYYHYFGTRVFNYDGNAYRNHNRLLGRVEGVDGIKTGYTRASGFNLLTSAKSEGRQIITVVLGGRSGRMRDAQVASLVGQHLPRAYAGARQTPKVVDVAALDDEDDVKPARREKVVISSGQPVAAAAIPAPVARPHPASRPERQLRRGSNTRRSERWRGVEGRQSEEIAER
ncbi:MAG: D-alanyl-D-alanine carboxypeptidase [Proteobacteria bacterium]|nr:D-alanyl-D-alanine carboxypeptidase [Pseudomonadota bacterium]